MLISQEVNFGNQITNVVCDEQHVYCADLTGKVRMYRLSDGVQIIREPVKNVLAEFFPNGIGGYPPPLNGKSSGQKGRFFP